MRQRLQITLDELATQKYLERVGDMVAAEVSEDCEPSGCFLMISIGGPYGSTASIEDGDRYMELGEADVELV